MKRTWFFATLLACLVTSCSSDNPAESSSFVEAHYYSVSLPQGEGYTVLGSKEVLGGEDYSFSLQILDGYDASNLLVTNNGTPLSSDTSIYTIPNVQSDIAIAVEGVVALPAITLSKASFLFFSGQITEVEKATSYYLEGVSGMYGGKACPVHVDLSEVHFDLPGEYVITYSLEGRSEISKKAKIVILSGSVNMQDVTIDVGSIYASEIVSFASYGEVGVDFSLAIDEQALSVSQVGYDSSRGGNYLKKDFLKNLSLGEHNVVATFNEKIHLSFNLLLEDKMEARYSFSHSSSDVCFLKEEVHLPKVEQPEDSLQNLSYRAFLNEKEITEEEAKAKIEKNEGDYDYTLRVFKGEKTIGEKTYKVHVRDAYSPFLFASSGGAKAKSGYSECGNHTLSFNYPEGDTNVFIDESYTSKENKENKKYVYIAFQITAMTTAGTIWTRDPKSAFDTNGNYVPTSKNPAYLGGDLDKVGKVFYRMIGLDGASMETDAWIMRGFAGTIEILRSVYCDLDYKDPVIEKENARDSLSSIPNSFDNTWHYIHVGSVGTGGGASMGGNCMDFQNTFPEDMEKAGYQSATLRIHFKDRNDILKLEAWTYEEGRHLSEFDVRATDGVAEVVLPLSLFDSIGNNRLFIYFNTSETSASTYQELRDTSKTYVKSTDFVVETVSYR